MIALLALVLAVNSSGCAVQNKLAAASLVNVIVGVDGTAVNSLILIAESENFFTAHGLRVTLKEYSSGRASVDALLKNEVNLVTASEFVMAGRVLAGDKLRALASIDKFVHNDLIARKDHGVNTVADLQGKTIGVPFRTAAQFYLGRFLELHHLRLDQVHQVDITPSESVDALVKGTLDAVLVWEPNASIIKNRMGDRVIQWPAQNDQPAYCTLISSEEWTQRNPTLVNRFLQALLQAEDLTIDRPGDAKVIIQSQLTYDDALMAVIWPKHQFQVTLEQSMILAMEDEARWMIANDLTTAREVPVFNHSIYAEGMLAVKPDVVNIIR